MDPQNGNQGGQQRYCPTPIMAPPPSSPSPAMQHQHVPQPSLSPAPHHTGYYSHGGGYPLPQQSQQQQSYYQNYSYQSHAQPPAPQATHYPQQQQHQHHQQWGHHSYYQPQQSGEVGSTTGHPQQQQQYQTEVYPPQSQSPYPAYVQQQHQQHQQQQRMHPVLAPPPPQQQQQQPQHALMNLSRFVSQQSPPSPVPSMPHSPTTPVPMGSPHYLPQQQPLQVQSQGHLTPQPIPQSMYPQSQTPQGHNNMALPPNTSNLHTSPSPYHSPTIPIHVQNSNHQDTPQRIPPPTMPPVAMSSPSGGNATLSNLPNPKQSPGGMTSSSGDPVQNPLNDISTSSVNHHMMSFSNGGGRSGSTSPSSSVSSRALLSPPPTPNPNPPVVSSASSNGHMIPVRLQNMQSGARTKANMRKMMQEQQISSVGGVGSGSGTEDSNNPNLSDPESSTGKKAAVSSTPKKSPRKSKKGAPSSNDVDDTPTPTQTETVVGGNNESVVPGKDNFPSIAAEASTLSQGRRGGGRKPGRSPKPKKVSSPEKETPKKSITTPTGRGRNRSSMSSNIETPENPQVETEQSTSPTRASGKKTPAKNLEKKKSRRVTEDPVPDEDEGEEIVEEQKKKKTGRGKYAVGKKKPTPSLRVGVRVKKIKVPPVKKNKKAKAVSKDEAETSFETPEEVLLQIQEEINAAPMRFLRLRPSKEPAKKPEEPKVDDRSRSTTARSKRGSVSYKEMSTSRSKSPKESVSPPRPPSSTSSTKKSPTSAKKSPKEKVKAVAKTSPRKLKDATPSPARSSLSKERSPISRRESTRASKESLMEEEIVETPKRASRKAKEKLSVVESPEGESDLKTIPSPKKVPKNKKSKRETTPVRMPSPRLAKEKTTPASPSKSLDVSDEQVEQPKTAGAKRKAKVVVAKRPKKGKGVTPVAVASSRKRKISNVPQPETTNQDLVSVEQEQSEPTKKKAKVTKKRGGARQRKFRTPKSAKLSPTDQEAMEGEVETAAEAVKGQTSSSLLEPGSGDTSQDEADTTVGSDTTIGSSDTNNLSLSTQSQSGLEMESSLERISSSTVVDNNISKTSVVSPVVLLTPMSRRRSKSPRQSIDSISVLSNGSSPNKTPKSGTKAGRSLSTELNLNLTPPLPMDKRSNQGQPLDPNSEHLLNSPAATSNLQLLSESVNSIMSSSGLTPGKISKPRKPRKPRSPKVKKNSDGEVPNQSPISVQPPHIEAPGDESKSEKKKKKKQTKHELKHLEFQQRKAYLEVEVAQALLDMKHNSSNSPSPSKSVDAITPTTSSQSQAINLDGSKSKKQTKPRKTPVKPRKRKNSLDTQIAVERPLTPLSSPVVPLSSTLSPDIATPMSKARKGPKQPRKPKKPRLDTQSQPTLTSTPTILAVPQINGHQGLNFSPNSSISFQNAPNKTSQVKVSKTVMLGTGETKTSTIADIESTIANVSTGFITPSDPSNMTSPGQKPKPKPRPRKKNVVTKILSVTSESIASGDPTAIAIALKPKRPRPRPRKKLVAVGGGLLPNLGPDSITADPMMTPLELQGTGASTSQDMGNNHSSAGPGLGTPLENSTASTPLAGEPVRKKRAYKTNRRSLFKFSSTPKPLPVPTVFVKSTALQHSNGPSTSTSDKDKAPSLKVIRGKAVFYRGGEKEELDAEPLMPKRGPTQFDPEVPWLCCFCSLGPHAQKLGDLFGPYYTEQTKGSGKSKTISKVETWMHQDCALWAGSVVLIGSKLHGLEDALSHSTKDSCTTCGNKGATIGCLKRGCKQAVHFPCAVRKSWKLDEETFHSFCPAHIS